jgi:hypothetical protein
LTAHTDRDAKPAARLRLVRPRAAFSLLFVLAVVGCSGPGGDGQEARLGVADLERVVLQPEDLPPAFRRFDEGRLTATDQPDTGERADPARFGRQEGWKARYTRRGTRQTRGPLVVESRVDLFEDADGAEQELAAYREETASESLEDDRLGDEGFTATLVQPGGSRGEGVRFFVVAWREANVTATVLVNGFEGKVTLGETIALARKQERRVQAELRRD